MAAAALAVSGCAADRTRSTYLLTADEVSRSLAGWTRTGKLYRQLDTEIIVDAIYFSGELREEWVKREAARKSLSAVETQGLREKQRAENDRVARFFLAVYTPGDERENLADTRSVWSLFLDTPSGPVRPMAIDKISANKTPWGTSLPFPVEFRTLYRVDFPREAAGTGSMDLALSSVRGGLKLSWKNGGP